MTNRTVVQATIARCARRTGVLAALGLAMGWSGVASAQHPVEALQPGQWYAVPNSRLSSIDPCPAKNCDYSGLEGQPAIMDDWNGGAFAMRYGTMGGLIVWGGGHNGYFGNEVNIFDVANLRWVRLSEPVANPGCNYTEAEYQDGSPCTPHTYDYLDYHPGTNSFVKLGSASDMDRGGFGSPRVHLFNLDTRAWRRGARKPSFAEFGHTGASSAYDPTRDVFWVLSGYGMRFAKYDPNAASGAGQWTEYNTFYIDIDGTAAVDPIRDLYVVHDGRDTRTIIAFDLKNPGADGVTVNVTGDTSFLNTAGNGFEWDPASQSFVGWQSGASVYKLIPPPTSSNWRTAAWTLTRVAPAANNTVTPTSPNANNTYSRWRYVPALNAFVLVNRTSENVYFYKLNSGGAQPTVTLSANPTTVNAQGSTALTWSTTNSNACSASANPAVSGWSGSKATSGTETVGPIAANTTFTLTCTASGGGSANGAVTVSVASSTPAPTVNFSAAPTSVAIGGSSMLTWTSTDATSCTGSNGLTGWAGSKQTSGSQSVGPISAAVTFNLSCTGAGGTTQRSATVSIVAAPTVTLTANPTTVNAGARSTLTWSSTNATSCTASGGWAGTKAASGNQQTPVLNQSSTFNLQCTGAGGSLQRSVTVTVNGSPPPPAVPTLTLSASPTAVTTGGSSTLTWTSANATSCTASGAWSGSMATSGSESTGALSNDATYTLQCTGAGGDVSQSTTVTVTAGGGGGGGTPPADNSSGGGGAMGVPTALMLLVLFLVRLVRGRRERLSILGIGTSLLVSGTALAQTPASDWVARSTAPGVAYATTFTQAIVDAGKFANGNDPALLANVTFNATSGTDGTGALRINVPSSTWADPGAWRMSFPRFWGSGMNHTRFYVQFRIRIPAGRNTGCQSGDGWKIANISSFGRSLTSFEVVPWNYSNTGWLRAYYGGSPPFTPDPSPDFIMPENEWITIYLDIQAARYGGSDANNRMIMRAARANATQWTTLYNLVGGNWYDTDSDAPDGFDGMWFTPYSTNRDRNVCADTWNEYDELIISTQPIAIPGGGVTPPPVEPTVTLTANPTSVQSGNGSTLTWSSTNATGCTASGGWAGNKATSGSEQTPVLTQTSTFTLQCTGTGGSTSVATNVNVTAPPPPAPTVTLTANPTTVNAGARSTLTWSSTNATSCTASGTWTGTKAVSGSEQTPVLNQTSAFTLACTGAGGSLQRSVTVTVSGAPPPPPAPTVTLTANPTTVNAGARSTLTWSSTNATSCTASGGWTGTKAVSGSQQTPVLNQSSTFNLQCTGAGGSLQRSVTVTVNGSPPPPAVPTLTLAANPTAVTTGGSSTLTWTSANATSCTASGAWSGSMATSGSESTGALNNDATYTLQCTGTGGSASQSTTVTVTAGGGGGGTPADDSSGGGGAMGIPAALLLLMLYLARLGRESRSIRSAAAWARHLRSSAAS